MGVEGLGGRDDDREHDQVGKGHAREDVKSAGALLALGLCGTLVCERFGLGAAFGFVAHFFEAMGALPEEQVRRDGCTQYRYQQCEVGVVELDMWDEGVGEDTGPLMRHKDCHDEVGQQRGAQHFEDERDPGERAHH